MSSVLVFGASGAVGRHLLPQLASGRVVFAVSRLARTGDKVEWLRGDLNDTRAAWPTVDSIFSLGPLDAFAAWLQRWGKPDLQRVIALGSMSAVSKQDSSDAGERAVSQRLRAAEAKILAWAAHHQAACTLFRATLIYGDGRDHSLAPIARFARRWRVLPLPRGATGLRQPVHAADLADACVAVMDNPATFGKTYALGGGERLPFDRMMLRLRSAAAGLVVPLPLPSAALRLTLRLRYSHAQTAAMLSRLNAALIADNGPATRDFGYAPRPFRGEDVLPK